MRIAQQPTAADAYDAHRMSGKASAQRTRITVSARINELLNETGELVENARRKLKSGWAPRIVDLS